MHAVLYSTVWCMLDVGHCCAADLRAVICGRCSTHRGNLPPPVTGAVISMNSLPGNVVVTTPSSE
jgi:hypothetical protein